MSRLRSIDLLRGVAVVLMIATHATDALLSPAFRDGPAWHYSSLLFGFVGPAFLLLSGLTLGLRQEVLPREASIRMRLLRRFLVLLVIAYWLQIPVLSLHRLLVEQRPEDLARLFDTNVLHVIAFCGIAIVLAATLLQSSWKIRLSAAMLAVMIVVATPYLLAAEIYRWLPIPLRSLIAPQPLATFPLLPYASYLLAGFLLGSLRLFRERPLSASLALTAGGAITVVLGLLLDMIIGEIPPHDDFWASSIAHSLLRAGGVTAVLGAFTLIPEAGGDTPHALERIGRRSLGMYLLHLILLYGSPMTMGMRYWLDGSIDQALDPAAVGVVAIILTVLCYQALLLWEWLRESYPHVARGAAVVWWGGFVVLFVVG